MVDQSPSVAVAATLPKNGRRGGIRQMSGESTKNDHGKQNEGRFGGFKGKKNYYSTGKDAADGMKYTPKGQRPRSSGPPCQVFQEDFAAFLQSVENSRFKVHRPECQCSKAKSIRERSSLSDDNQLQGLLVVPGSNGRFLPSAYLHPVAENLEDSEKAMFAKELELKEIIFPPGGLDPDIKVSCAACLLERVPNGFVCINSTSRASVEYARDQARKNATSLVESGKKLHADHAHEVVVLDSKVLRTIVQSPRGKKGGKPPPNADPQDTFLKDQLEMEGVDIDGVERIVLGHHIKSLLKTLKKKDSFFLAIIFRDQSEDRKGSSSIEIDLPGGKRHLGESSFECAIRETLEETSLLVDDTWHAGNGQPLKNALKEDFCNAFYDLRPPPRRPVAAVEDIGQALSQVRISENDE
jgi:8-oxo-dGTP pyrophosphatase MutT (NUDIX family)